MDYEEIERLLKLFAEVKLTKEESEMIFKELNERLNGLYNKKK